jgi:putative transposase
VEERRRCIEAEHPGPSMARQCELIGLSRACDYRGEPDAGEDAENLDLMRLIDEAYRRRPLYGSRKMVPWLRSQGQAVNRKRVRRLMRRPGLQSAAPKPDTARPAPEHTVDPYLLSGLRMRRPNQVWCTDITSIRLARGFVYLTAVMDGHSRDVLMWEVTMDDGFRASALASALRRHGRPEIVNSVR